MTNPTRTACFLSLFVLALVSTACGGAGDRPHSWQSDPAASVDPEPEPEPAADAGAYDPYGPCNDGDQQTCKITLPSHGSVTSCVNGTRWCYAGAWGECEAPDSL